MAGRLTVSGRVVGSHGRYKRETGKVTPTAWDASEWIETKLGRIIWFKMQSVDGTAAATLICVKNSSTATNTKNGSVNLFLGGQANGYVYEAIGVG